jgi:hypothetical protein
LKNSAEDLGYKLQPRTFTFDFEIAAIKGCLFHFSQSIFKHMIQVGLKKDYENDENVRNWFKSLFILSQIPENLVTEEFDRIFREHKENDRIVKMNRYFNII